MIGPFAVLAVVAWLAFAPALVAAPIDRYRRHLRWHRTFTNPEQDTP